MFRMISLQIIIIRVLILIWKSRVHFSLDCVIKAVIASRRPLLEEQALAAISKLAHHIIESLLSKVLVQIQNNEQDPFSAQ